MTAAAMGSDYLTPMLLTGRTSEGRCRRRGIFLQDLGADFSRRDLAQRDDRGLVAVGLDHGRGAGAELAGAIVCCEGKLKAVADALQAIVDGDAGHGTFPENSAVAAALAHDALELRLG